MNFIDTVNRTGGTISDLRMLNDGQVALMALQEFYDALGVNRQADIDTALKFADAWTKPMLRAIGPYLQRHEQRQAATQQRQQPRGRATRGQRVPARFREGIKGSKVPRSKTNQDIFSGPGFEAALNQSL
jgi:hypothetical protein